MCIRDRCISSWTGLPLIGKIICAVDDSGGDQCRSSNADDWIVQCNRDGRLVLHNDKYIVWYRIITSICCISHQYPVICWIGSSCWNTVRHAITLVGNIRPWCRIRTWLPLIGKEARAIGNYWWNSRRPPYTKIGVGSGDGYGRLWFDFYQDYNWCRIITSICGIS